MTDSDNAQPISPSNQAHPPADSMIPSLSALSGHPATPKKNPTVAMVTPPAGFDDPLFRGQIGNYQLTGLLGTGSFGKVYKALDISLNREVAIKFLHGDHELYKQMLFEREAKAIAALSKHPNIVAIYQWGEHEGRNYVVLEYVESSASKLLEEHPDGLPLTLALRIAMECAEALQAAHDMGILHRDVKPANILIEPRTMQSKLTDFGLARFGLSNDFTIQGTISGSPAFMSPEQANAGTLDGRTDVFSLGVTLYELICGRRPFDADTPEETIERIRNNTRITLQSRRPDLPDGLCAMVEKATAHARESRYSSAGEMARQLRLTLQALEHSGHLGPNVLIGNNTTLSARQKKKDPIRRYAKAMISVGILAIFSLIATFFFLGRPDGSPTAGSTEPTLTAAIDAMNRGDFPSATSFYQAYLKTDPENPDALYGLALSLLQEGKPEQAEPLTESIKPVSLQAEVEAALSFVMQQHNPRNDIEAAATKTERKYPQVLLAKLDVMDHAYEQAAQRLEKASANQFNFNYQYSEALQTLGQAYFHMNQLTEAQNTFSQMAKSPILSEGRLATAYLSEITQRLDETRRQEIHDRALEIKKLLSETGNAEATTDAWSSRPLTFFVLPSEVKRSRYAFSSGLSELLPTLLGDQLDGHASFNLVDRSIINEILTEQELSGYLSSKEGQLRLGQVLGARLVLKCDFVTLDDKEKIMVKMDDVETTERVPIPSLDIPKGTASEELVQSLATAILNAARHQYPVQGRLYRGATGLEINIGSLAGVTKEMRFAVMPDKEATPIPGALLTLASTPGTNTSVVLLSGADPQGLSSTTNEGWFVREIDEGTQ